MEANPGTVREDWLDLCLSQGVNRFSIGMQAAQDRVLETLGRIHRLDAVKKTVSLLRRKNIFNYNLDLMFGIPGQTKKDWQETLGTALDVEPAHLSCYGLIPEDGTPLKTDLDQGQLILPEPEEEREMYYLTKEILFSNGSIEDIAGIVNERGNVLGMMPHPERAVSEMMGGSDGLALFKSILKQWRESHVSHV